MMHLAKGAVASVLGLGCIGAVIGTVLRRSAEDVSLDYCLIMSTQGKKTGRRGGGIIRTA